MKFQVRRGYILVVSETLVRLAGLLATGTDEGKGLAIFPFIFVREEQYVQPWLINHELIHFRQSIETLFIGLIFINIFEDLYAKFVLKKSKMERYLYSAADQEAYRNQNNPNYLKNRPFGNIFRYLKDKREFTFGERLGEIRFLD